jgi:hypothetical protein
MKMTQKRFLEGFFGFFSVLYSTQPLLTPLRFLCVGGCWRKIEPRTVGIGCRFNPIKFYAISTPSFFRTIVTRAVEIFLHILGWKQCNGKQPLMVLASSSEAAH